MMDSSNQEALTQRSKALKPLEAVVTFVTLLMLCTLAGWSFLYELGAGSLYDWDEATYGQIAREMMRRGEWLTPIWNGHYFFDKPPAMFWLMRLSMPHTATPELAVRLPAALLGIFAIGLTALLGRKMLGRGGGLLAGTILLVASERFSSSFVGLGRQGMLDVPLGAMAVWTMLHFWLGLRNRWHWVMMGVPFGLAIMIRSFSVTALFAVLLLCVLLLPWVGQKLTKKDGQALAGGMALAALIALPWHLAVTIRHGRVFLAEYVGINFFGLATKTAENLDGDWTFYFTVLQEGWPGWVWLLPLALIWAGWRVLRLRDPKAMILLVWVSLPFLLYSSAASKLAWYVLMIYPGLALLLADLILTLTSRSWSLQATTIFVLLIGTSYWNLQTIKPLHPSWAVKSVGWCVANAVPSDETVAFFDPHKSYLSDRRAFWNVRSSVFYYADRPMVALWERSTVEQWLAEGGRFVWSNSDDVTQLEGLLTVVGREDNQLLLRDATQTDVPPAPEWACHQ